MGGFSGFIVSVYCKLVFLLPLSWIGLGLEPSYVAVSPAFASFDQLEVENIFFKTAGTPFDDKVKSLAFFLLDIFFSSFTSVLDDLWTEHHQMQLIN